MKRSGYFILLWAASLAVVNAVAQDIDPASDPNVQPDSATLLNGYQLAWSDEFNDSAFDETKWNYRQGDDSRTFVKSYQQAANNSESGGLYHCHLKKETRGTKAYTAGGLITKKRFRYGYYESKLKVPEGAGWHTSFWMMRYGAAPSGETNHIELDVFENDSKNLYDYSANVHRWKPDPHVAFGTKKVYTPSLAADFHVFGCEFTPELINYFMDGVLVQSIDANQLGHCDVNIWLTSLGLCYGADVIDDSMLPAEALYDYVRYFELGPHAAVEITSPHSAGATVANTNAIVSVSATIAPENTVETPSIIWSKTSGPGSIYFIDAGQADTGARFSADGFYEVSCSAIIGTVTNSDTVGISVNAPVTLTLQHGVNGYDNPCTFIRGDLPIRNSGADNEMIIGRWGNKGLRGLLAFDLSALDPSAVIQQADLQLYNYNGSGSVGTMELRELSTTFVEGSGDGWSDASGSGTGATWYSRTGSQNWNSAGSDFYPTVLSSMPGYNAAVVGYKTFPSTPDFITAAQGALDAGQPLNLIISSPSTESGGSDAISRLSSDDASSTDQHPELTISYLGNYLPNISAGPYLTGTTNTPLTLRGMADHADAVEWDIVSGPGSVLFSDADALSNSAAFSTPGRYWIRLRGFNSRGAGFHDISVSIVDDRPFINGAEILNDMFVFEINSVTGLTYTLQTTPNLMDSWADLYSTNAPSDPLALEAPLSTNDIGFFRIILNP